MPSAEKQRHGSTGGGRDWGRPLESISRPRSQLGRPQSPPASPNTCQQRKYNYCKHHGSGAEYITAAQASHLLAPVAGANRTCGMQAAAAPAESPVPGSGVGVGRGLRGVRAPQKTNMEGVRLLPEQRVRDEIQDTIIERLVPQRRLVAAPCVLVTSTAVGGRPPASRQMRSATPRLRDKGSDTGDGHRRRGFCSAEPPQPRSLKLRPARRWGVGLTGGPWSS